MTRQSLFKAIAGLRYLGEGVCVRRSIYKFPNTFWVITRVQLGTTDNDGKIFGRLVWNGRMKAKDEQIRSPLKKEWEIIDFPDYNTFIPKR